jgi:hypothetical protein
VDEVAGYASDKVAGGGGEVEDRLDEVGKVADSANAHCRFKRDELKCWVKDGKELEVAKDSRETEVA